MANNWKPNHDIQEMLFNWPARINKQFVEIQEQLNGIDKNEHLILNTIESQQSSFTEYSSTDCRIGCDDISKCNTFGCFCFAPVDD